MRDSSKFKFYCVQFKNSYILLIEVINFQSRLTNFVDFFEALGIGWATVEALNFI